MNVLEKILEEIEEYEKKKCSGESLPAFESGIDRGYLEAKNIIRSHMGEVSDVGEEDQSILCIVGEDGMLTSYDDTYDIVIHCSSKEDQNRTIELINSFNWIPVRECLPEVPEGTEDDDCPEFNVTIKGADKATTLKYAPDGTWFDDSGEVYKVVAWKPLPEPYKGE